MTMETIQEYKILEKIDDAKGPPVFRAEKAGFERSFVIKFYDLEFPTLSQLERFKQEYDIIKNLSIEGVVKIHDILDISGRLALVFEDFRGKTLKEICARERLSVVRFLEIAISLSKTLGHLHKENLVHLDINPRNILIHPRDNTVKLTGFGISSCMTGENRNINTPYTESETLSYLSPEQTGRINRRVDSRSDLYSLGVTFYEMLTGRLPFISDDPMEIVHAHIALEPVAPVNIYPDIPEPLSDIILKLMEKTAEARYQNSFGLMADLQQCHDSLIHTGSIHAFTLGEKDISLKFNMPQKIYGRDKEISALLSAFDRCAAGNVEMMLISGYPGIGKSALINEVHKPIAARKGLFGSGKYEQFRRDVPYSGVIYAFQGLIRYLLTEPEDVIEKWEKDLLDALSGSGRLIIQMIPDLELIIGPQPDVPELGPAESQNRFDHIFNKFVKVFAQKNHPLVLFLDDLQWTDSASLELVKKFILDPELKYFFLIGSYRHDETDDAHPAMLTIKDIIQNGIHCTSTMLNPITPTDIEALIIDFLRCSPDRALNLAQLVHEKTGGNPFFINQFLRVLYEEKLIAPVPSGWEWDDDKIRKMQITHNVVDLLAGKMTKLNDRLIETLKICACIGSRFDLETLSTVLSRPVSEILPDISDILQEGYIRLTQDDYSFQHDRIREAAYSLIPEEKRIQLHRQIGHFTLANCRDAELPDKVFFILNHLNQSISIISDTEERDALIRLNLMAGIKAKTSAAYSPALTYLKTGMSLLSDDSWKTSYDLTLAYYINTAEAACLTGDFEAVNRLCAEAEKFVKDVLTLSRFSEVEILSNASQNKLKAATHVGLEILKKLNVSLPRNPNLLNALSYLVNVRIALRGKTVEDLLDLPRMTDPHMLQAMRIIMKIITSAYQHNSNFFAILAVKGVLLSLRYGNTPASAPCYSTYGAILCGVFNNFDSGYAFGELAFNLVERFGDMEYKSNCYLATGLLHVWKKPYREILPFLFEGYKTGLESGSYDIAASSLFIYNSVSYLANKPLHELEQTTGKYLKALKQINQQTPYNYMSMDMQAIQNLMGKSRNPARLSGEYYDIEKMIPIHLEVNDGSGMCYAYNNAIVMSYLFGDYQKACAYSKLQKKYLIFMSSTSYIPLHYCYDSLSMLAVWETEKKRKRKRILRKITANQKRLKKFSNACPANYAAMYYLVEAEKYRALKKFEAAAENYTKSIELSKAYELILMDALGNELAAGFYLSLKQHKIADMYMSESRYAYEKFGAAAKVTDLETKYSGRLFSIISKTSPHVTTNRTATMGTHISSSLDLSSVMKASQAISGEIVLGKLLTRMMWIVIENAGAQKGVIVLENDGGLFVEAEGGTEKEEINVLQSIPLDAFDGISSSIVSYVVRSKETLILNDASKDMNFINDPYIRMNKPKSVLCSPILGQGKLIGILYLENNLSTGTFTADRLEFLGILSSQIVISIENARLYANLETKVRERTAQLKQAQEENLRKAHRAGMADIAKETLHNVGNILTSIKISAENLNAENRDSALSGLVTANQLLRKNMDDLDQFINRDPKGRKLLDYYLALEPIFSEEKNKTGSQLNRVIQKVDDIEDVIQTLESYIGTDDTYLEKVHLMEEVRFVLETKKDSLTKKHIGIKEKYSDVPMIRVQKSKLAHILDNVIVNAREALENAPPHEKVLSIELRHKDNKVLLNISDNGEGISGENIQRIFFHGFTTKKNRSGHSLHNCANNMTEMGGKIWAESQGVGKGAVFTLEFPVAG